MTANDLPYQLFDADNHLYETEEALTKFLPEKYKDVIKYVQVDGRTKIAIRGQISDYIPNPTFEVVARPGAMEDYFKNGNPEGKSRREIFGKSMKSIPAFREPAARLELMDELRIERTLMFPTLASLVEERMRDDPELIHAVVHSLNQWLYETWSFNYKDRIFTVPVISLPIVDKAIEELEWCVERGAKAILVRPAPVPGYRGPRSFALPEFDPFWKRVVELDVLVTQHSSDSGYARHTAEWDGADKEMLPFVTNTFHMVNEWRPIQDAVASWVCHGALLRFPELRIAVIENGASWLPGLLQNLADTFKKAPEGFGMKDPVEAVKNSIHVSPFWEEDFSKLTALIGAERVLFGSDYPHPEGLAEPTTYIQHIQHLPFEDQKLVMGGNLARLLKV
ncbi:Predicted metal-dependent hydrolase, TIM-barrel fold [Rhodococcus rhodochrous J3]|jgi:predicted TIM-barrel fold metal-dependent hydrolase|uniref:Amidohydrolase n=3 Tax=Rhodococcus TaxID=1827 RepID=A0AA47AB10_RHORH|nr:MULTISPECIES: amidohydrolase family protein [Rhodococcus]KSZ60130.1 amidohydrolase [Rhodococcus pyridinivorans KG-16]MBF4479939.1 amidohydrolase [Rhodococcus rhodochrous]MCB8910353.1 amidohydrolase [Rhodococcus rhodochrous]MDC3728619.1 amidohydrolase [Rhodococcus sp. Rp3]MDJ0398455.1 amidohydrolase family protein [Rhodococcus rhodochrous]